MKRFHSIVLAISIAAFALLAGCAQIQAKIASSIAPVAKTDLADAVAIAKKRGGPNEAVHEQCLNGLSAWVDALPKDSPGPVVDVPKVSGIFSFVEEADTVFTDINDLTSQGVQVPPLDQATWNACVVSFSDTKIAAGKVVIAMVALAKGAGALKAAATLQKLQASGALAGLAAHP